ncbi:hypothetical protein RhiirA5_419867 [Rhizophagus irregularis]|uniref:Serine-threonine/tyrosine-protein kinase catalytic domain-containing protein n=1 Tax=Rhizophagus irregularis TaxID=588596 RepID=A0A2I1FEI5_9GLOM|nr:hypothetical protein RhiirA5_419867 [Rhizophagus irregularis]PKC59437.1 hypothetical protein RhiirA1_469444 [Rhizophagus irregularis]PKY32758.1 hypothetical protein RhiirB3_451172 [Rhizophagus irregularis]
MKRCWDSDPNKRPPTDELVEILACWFGLLSKVEDWKNTLSCRKIDYSAKLNEILNQKELSSKLVIHGEKENCIIMMQH